MWRDIAGFFSFLRRSQQKPEGSQGTQGDLFGLLFSLSFITKRPRGTQGIQAEPGKDFVDYFEVSWGSLSSSGSPSPSGFYERLYSFPNATKNVFF